MTELVALPLREGPRDSTTDYRSLYAHLGNLYRPIIGYQQRTFERHGAYSEYDSELGLFTQSMHPEHLACGIVPTFPIFVSNMARDVGLPATIVALGMWY